MIAGALEIQFYANMARIAKDMNDAKGIVGGAMNSIERSVATAKAALGALGVGLSAGYFVSLIKGSIDAADAMNDLSQRIGINVASLAKYELASRQSGTSMESISKGIKGLSVNLVEHGAALRAAGITAKDADGAMKQVADIFAAMPDGIEKTTLSVKLFGKSGMDLIPMLNLGSAGLGEAAEKSAKYAAVMAALAPQSDQFNDHLAEIAISSKVAGLSMTNDLMPALNTIATNIALAAQESGALMAAWVALGGVGSAVFTDNLLTPLAKVNKSISSLKEDIESYNPLALFGPNIAQMRAELAQLEAERMSIEKAQAAGVKAAADAGKRRRDEMTEDLKARIKKIMDALGGGDAKKDPYEALQKKAADYIKTLEKETAQLGLTAEQKKMIEASLVAMTLKTEAEQTAVMAAAAAWARKAIEVQAATDAAKFAAEAIESANKALDDQAAKLGAEVAAAERALEIYGLTKSQIEGLTIARLEESLAIEQARDADAATLAYYEKEIDARKRIRAAMAGVEVKDAAKKAAEDTAAEWKRMTDDVERGLTDALMRGFEGGADGGKVFIESLKNMLKTAAFKMVIQAFVSPVTGAMGSAFGVSGAPGASGGGGFAGLASALSQGNAGIYNAYGSFASSSLGQTFGLSDAASFVGPQMPGQAAQVGLTELGSSLQSALPYLPAIASLAQGNFGAAAGSAIGAYFGGPIGSAIGSAIGGMLDGGGGDDPHNNPQVSGYHFTLSKAGVSGAAGLASPSSFVAGPTSGEGWWGDNASLSAEQVAALNQQTSMVFAQGYLLAQQLGMDASTVDKASVISTLHGNPGNGAIAGYFSSIDQAFAALADAIAYQIVPNLNEFQQSGESLAQTAARLSQEFALTNQAAAMMGKDITGLSLKARDQLVTLLGGLPGASATLGSYYQAYHSEAERTADTRGGITATLRAIGISNVPTTRDQFRALVEGQDLATESGRAMYATLLSVSEAFAGITKSAEDAANALSTDRFRTRQDYLYAMVTGQMPAYAGGGDHPGGWAIVGENGPELRNMGPSRIYSNGDSRALLDTSELQSEVAALRADLRTIGATLAGTSKRTAKVLDRWDADGLPAERVLA